MTPDFVARRPHNHELFVKQRIPLLFGNREGYEAEIEAAIMQPGDGFLGHIYRHPNLCLRKLLPQLSQGFSELIDQRGHAGSEVEGPGRRRQIVFKFLLALPHPLDQVFRVFRQAQGRRVGISRFPLRTNSSV